MTIRDQKIALIGGAGFIGHNLALSLRAQGANVLVVDALQVNNLTTFSSTQDVMVNRELYVQLLHQRMDLLNNGGIPLCVQDARDYHALSRILGKFKPTTIVLLAAVAHADKANKDPYTTFDHNLRTLENALDYARIKNVGHFVYFSSSMVYGNFTNGQVTEESVCEPIGIYGALKFAGEKLVIAYNQVFNLPYTIIRPSALYGPRCVSRRVSQIFIENALQGVEIKVNGDGSDKLDFTFIDDLVQGINKVLENDASKNQIFNLTFGESRSIGDMANILKQNFPKAKLRYLPKDKLMPSRGTLSVEKAKRLLGYSPTFSLEKGYQSYIDWYRSVWDKWVTLGTHKMAT